MNILERIAHIRRETIKSEGYTLGSDVPAERRVPLVPLGIKPFVICEIKRRSPSKGKISEISDPVKQASLYVDKGIRNISVLTEEDHFGGSLNDLIAVKNAFPHIAVLRKDFLLEKEDVDVSFRAGADAILLIAALLDKDKLEELYDYARSMNLSVLMEVHNIEEIDKVRSIKPLITGINSRNLKTFRIDQALPLKLKEYIDWETKLVYESGIASFNEAIIPFESKFSGILVGESVVRDPDLIDDLIQAETRSGEANFWNRLYKEKNPSVPRVKICGITNREDAEAAVKMGADILGFVMADSPRKADPALIRSISDMDVLKVAVLVTENAEPEREVMKLLEKGYIDAVQFHGNESPRSLRAFSYPCYKALRLKDGEDTEEINRFPGPRVLIDAYSEEAYGGTGKRINSDFVKSAAAVRPLWMAGGLSEENIRSVIDDFSPELVDVSSKLESEKGKKDHGKMKRFFMEINNGNL
ncbi:MAG: bifunctional indole-3-glycerol phosphate synthase/phosphoribosylanthranilate isomerase [Spirochaetaceae bacterium]|jgi:indole-3-glycerol phosphate synthase/phosphoribosylanthranilate isomerase|nr:bifunctional indole-3-glycerol phosphate synthase/phosphoribosylanthranilate isomerase [Spirochaetaceae bacterium]